MSTRRYSPRLWSSVETDVVERTRSPNAVDSQRRQGPSVTPFEMSDSAPLPDGYRITDYPPQTSRCSPLSPIRYGLQTCMKAAIHPVQSGSRCSPTDVHDDFRVPSAPALRLDLTPIELLDDVRRCCLHPIQCEIFFAIARGSIQECIPLLELAARRSLMKADEQRHLYDKLDELAKMISGLIKGLDNRTV